MQIFMLLLSISIFPSATSALSANFRNPRAVLNKSFAISIAFGQVFITAVKVDAAKITQCAFHHQK